MKKTVFDKPAYSVAMSQETGCIVMVKTEGRKVSVIGSLDRAMSMKFADGVLQWMPEALRAQLEPAVDAETLN
jgi:hypothetical protein